MHISQYSDHSIKKISMDLKDILVITNKPGHQISINLGEHFRIVYLSKGGTEFIFSDRMILVKSGDILYIPPNTSYSSKWDPDQPSTFFMLDLKLPNDDSNIDFGTQPRILFHDDYRFYDELLNEIERLSSDIPYGWLNRFSLCMKVLYYISADSSNEKYGESYWKIRNGIRFIEENFTSDFLVSDAADVCMMSTGHFRKTFTNLKGMSPVAYKNKLRIHKSMELLKSGQFNVSEAGQAVGINDVKHFSKLFKQITGITPSKIIKDNKQ